MPECLGLVLVGKAAAQAAVPVPTCQARPLQLQAVGACGCPVLGAELCHAASGNHLFPRGFLCNTGPLLEPLSSGAKTVMGNSMQLPSAPDKQHWAWRVVPGSSLCRNSGKSQGANRNHPPELKVLRALSA